MDKKESFAGHYKELFDPEELQLLEDKAKKEQASKVQDASQQFDDLFNN